MIDTEVILLLFRRLKSKNASVVFAESLTGGLIASEFSKIPGSSVVFWGSFVAYSPFAKERILSVPRSVITTFGVVSAECAVSMAEGALRASFAIGKDYPTYALAVTGLAGPVTRNDLCKVGTVYIATSEILKLDYSDNNQEPVIRCASKVSLFCFEGNRDDIREQTLNSGIKMLLDIL